MIRLIAIFLLSPAISFAQKFIAEAPVPAVEKDGFYKVVLPPRHSRWLERDFRNVRIIDGDGVEIPYTTEVGYYEFEPVPVDSFTSADIIKDHSTWVFINLEFQHFVDSLSMDIDGPAFYKRKAHLRTDAFEKTYFELVSTKKAGVTFSGKTRELKIQIENKDNPPLKVVNVAAWQRHRSLDTWLEKGKTYKVAFGADLQWPVYDIEYFRASIPKVIPRLTPGPIVEIADPQIEKSEETPTYFNNRNMIWIAIIAVVAVLAAMSFRMIRERSAK